MFDTKKFVNYLINKRVVIASAMLVITIFFGFGLTKIVVDNETMKAVPESLQEKLDFTKLNEKFPSPFTLLVLTRFSDSSLTIYEKRDEINRVAKQFEEILVDSVSGVTETIHAGTLKVPIKGGFLGLKVTNLLPKDSSKLSSEKLFERLDESRSLAGSFISEDQKLFGMVVKMNPEVQRPKVVGMAVDIAEQIDSQDGVDCYLTGATAMSFFTSRKMRSDFRILLPLTFLISALLLFAIFRRPLFVIAPLAIIGVAVVWTFGFMGWMGFTFSVVSSVIPVILFPIGLADSIHVLKTFSHHHKNDKKSFEESFTATYHELLKPILLTSITTFIGFGSFVFSQISWTRSFGVFTGLGVMLSLLFTVILLPIFLYYGKREHESAREIDKFEALPTSILPRLSTILFKTPFAIILFLLVAVVSVIGVRRIYFESNPISMFSKDSPIVKSDEFITDQFGGTQFFSILLTPEDGDFKEKGNWDEVDEIIAKIKEDESVGNVLSLLPVINRTSQILSSEEISKPGIATLFGSGGKKFNSVVRGTVTEDFKTTKIQIVCKNIPKFKYTKFARDIRADIKKSHPGWSVHIAGPALLIDSMITLLIHTQVSSLITAFLSVFVVLTLLFRSFRVGFYTTLPIVLSTVFVYSLMGFFGVAVNSVTVIIVNTSIGIGIDYAIHFTSGFLYCRDNHESNYNALMHTIHDKGGAILFNTAVVGLGFLVLMFSSFPPIRSFGLFIFISMVVSSLFSIIFLPVLFRRWRE
jgi:hydrophobe/amphiphile efflux-3 (HAE3) family protein